MRKRKHEDGVRIDGKGKQSPLDIDNELRPSGEVSRNGRGRMTNSFWVAQYYWCLVPKVLYLRQPLSHW